MIKYTRFFIIILLAVSAVGAKAQSTATTSSPYSRYGLGDIDPSLLPQSRGMGGIATAINKINNYNTINVQNPASYGFINYTTFDVGLYGNIVSLGQTGQTSVSNANFRLSHINFAVPVSRRSALSFGLMPYSEMGYNYKQSESSLHSGLPTDTNTVNYLYKGDGGLSKAYFGYGIGLTKHFYVGGNISYIFGNLVQTSSTEIPKLYGVLNSRIEQSNSIGGLNYDLGLQYSFDFENDTKHLTLGYSTSTGNSINSTASYIVSQYTYDSSGNQNTPADSVVNRQSAKSKIKLPQINHFGISYQYDNHYLVGADFTMGNWSNLTIGGTNAGFQNSKTFNIGGQYTPNNNALRNYFARVDYRLGFIYDQTYLNLNNTNINRYAVTFGLGLPLAPSQTLTTFYKINLSAEVGKRGTVDNGLVKENYVNIHLGFTLNDKWFQKYKFQ
ncbi:hypothetical protein [Mucilaginibacter xinganensis]|uniref:Long-chain fatty acid transport protein n=1 Tax=Mucilaginibacter xinganensis TaxID=1234841 RepID=A0A223P1Z0_9SPHI|nr:hypothetical protein [Mucilaginibacter xinganensis]ASU36132.1 hypothetical protein MuYL_4247 [Mucilaginibacter xinganensis]